MPQQAYRLHNRTRGSEVASHVLEARGWWARLRGLIGRHALAPGEGLWINPCNGVHTFGMRFAIDVLTLDEKLRVLAVAERVAPGRVLAPVRGGRSVLELPAGAASAAGVRTGDALRLEDK